MVDESRLIRTIVLGADWQEVLEDIVVEEGMDPLGIDLIRLAEAFMEYLQNLKTFDFRIPARFILIAAVLLRMKCELMLEEEEKKAAMSEEKLPALNIEDIPQLSPPLVRKPTRKVTLDELIRALNKTIEFKERKESREIRLRRAVETLIEPEEDIEMRISSVFERVAGAGEIKFSDLVPRWERKEIIGVFMPLLYLCIRSKVSCEQAEMFGEIYIKVLEEPHKEAGP